MGKDNVKFQNEITDCNLTLVYPSRDVLATRPRTYLYPSHPLAAAVAIQDRRAHVVRHLSIHRGCADVPLPGSRQKINWCR